jgi:hypothetical protein
LAFAGEAAEGIGFVLAGTAAANFRLKSGEIAGKYLYRREQNAV